MTYHEHIESLANQHGVTVDWQEGTRDRAWRKTRRVRLRPVRSAKTYAIALHELGHVLGRQTGCRIDREVQAWEWAKANALCWRAPMKATACRCLRLYARWANGRNGVIRPTDTHPIHTWIGREE